MYFKKILLLSLFICSFFIGFAQVSTNSLEDMPDIVIDENTYVKVCFWADHTYVSDLGFYLKAPGHYSTWPGLSGVVELAPCLSDWNPDTGFNSTGIPFTALGCEPFSENNSLNSGDNLEEFCFSTHVNIDGSFLEPGNPEHTACINDMSTPLTGTFAPMASWDKIYGFNASEIGWAVQIYDSQGSDVGFLTHVTITFHKETSCGEAYILYDSESIMSVIIDDAYTPGAASIYLVPFSDESYYYSNAPQVQICKVEANNNDFNEIIWENPITEDIDFYNIYRADEFGDDDDQYSLLDSVDFDSYSTYIDSSSDSDVESYFYKILPKDMCGYNSSMSDFHKTFFLQSILMPDNIWELTWESYEGAVYSEIEILRGTTPEDLEVIETVAASETTYTDTTSLSGTYWYYRLRAVLPYSCNPAKSQDYLYSNIIEVENLNVGIHQDDNQESIQIFPNPTTGYFKIENANEVSNLTIYDKKGSIVLKSVNVENGIYDVSSLASGEYIIEFETQEILKYRKLIVQ